MNIEDLNSHLELSAELVRKKDNKSRIGGVAHFFLEWTDDDYGFARIITIDPKKEII